MARCVLWCPMNTCITHLRIYCVHARACITVTVNEVDSIVYSESWQCMMCCCITAVAALYTVYAHTSHPCLSKMLKTKGQSVRWWTPWQHEISIKLLRAHMIYLITKIIIKIFTCLAIWMAVYRYKNAQPALLTWTYVDFVLLMLLWQLGAVNRSVD